ncbi:MAG: hypothetical protein AB1668_01815 [Nanoarchaeota archaeon]
MKVTIDTKEDSYEDIKKIMHLLTSIIERKEDTPANTSADTTAMMNMFSDPTTNKIDAAPDKAPDFSSFLNLTKKKEEQKREMPRIEYF